MYGWMGYVCQFLLFFFCKVDDSCFAGEPTWMCTACCVLLACLSVHMCACACLPVCLCLWAESHARSGAIPLLPSYQPCLLSLDNVAQQCWNSLLAGWFKAMFRTQLELGSVNFTAFAGLQARNSTEVPQDMRFSILSFLLSHGSATASCFRNLLHTVALSCIRHLPAVCRYVSEISRKTIYSWSRTLPSFRLL